MTRSLPKTFSIVLAAIVMAALGATLPFADAYEERVEERDIVDVAVAAGEFSTLAAALDAADLVSTLKGKGPFTVFAPTDAAFADLPDGTLESLLQPENRDQLTSILTYHVVPGKVMAADVVNLSGASTVNGADIVIKVVDGKVMINDATVITADVDASNGVIHVIDKVILPM